MAKATLVVTIIALVVLLLAFGSGMPAHEVLEADHLMPAALCWVALALPQAFQAIRRSAAQIRQPFRSHVAPLRRWTSWPVPFISPPPSSPPSAVIRLRALRC